MAGGGSDSEVDCIYLGQWFVTRGDFALQQTFSNIWRHFGDMLLASSEWRARMLINIVKYIGKLFTTKN